MTPAALSIRYALFAGIATCANLGTQRVVLWLGQEAWAFGLAMLAGTAVGLAIKYLLDKRWIFQDRATGVGHHGRLFALYTATGLVTTAIFWGTETAFWLVWRSDMMREMGAVLGLSIGYVSKFMLDRRFVFADQDQAASS